MDYRPHTQNPRPPTSVRRVEPDFVDGHAFEQITADDLRTSLGESLGDPAGVDAMWQRWFEEVNGAEDLGG